MSGGLNAEIAQRMRDKYDPSLEQKALDWIGAILNEQVPTSRGKDGDALYEWLKDGVLLCRLINAIKPNTIPTSKITMKPRHHLEERENINLYLGGCLRLGVPSQDMCLLSDLHSRHSIPAVLSNIYALGRQAQVTSSFDGPRLGVKYSVSIEEQQRRKKKKEIERQQFMAHRRMKSDSQLRRRTELELEQRQEALKDLEKKESRKLTRQLSKGKISLEAFRQKSHENLEKIGTLKNSNADLTGLVPGLGAVKYGMDREIAQKRKKQYSTEKEEQVMDWIEAVTGEDVNCFYDDLRDGKILCKLLNCFREKMIRRINTRDTALSHRDNITMYLEGCARIGVDRGALFAISDLYEQKDLNAVVNHFFLLSKRVELLRLIPGPFLQNDGTLSAPPSPRDYLIDSAPSSPRENDNSEEKSNPVRSRTQRQSVPLVVSITGDKKEDNCIESVTESEEEAKEQPDYSVEFGKTSFLTMLTPRFLVRSMFHTVMSVQYAFVRG